MRERGEVISMIRSSLVECYVLHDRLTAKENLHAVRGRVAMETDTVI